VQAIFAYLTDFKSNLCAKIEHFIEIIIFSPRR
jgi:hypothetical protein